MTPIVHRQSGLQARSWPRPFWRYNQEVSTSTRDRLRGAWGQVARVTIVPEQAAGPAPWPGALVVATGIAVGAVAWLGGRALIALGTPPAVGGLVAIALAIVVGAGLIERGSFAAVERWLGARWAPVVVGGILLGRVTALWSIAPRAWLGALVFAAAVGRLAAVGLQRLGDVGPAGRGRTLIVGPLGAIELAVAAAVVIGLALLVTGAPGLIILLIAGVAAAGFGLGVQLLDRELGGDSLAAIAAAIELIVLVGVAAAEPALLSPFVR